MGNLTLNDLKEDSLKKRHFIFNTFTAVTFLVNKSSISLIIVLVHDGKSDTQWFERRFFSIVLQDQIKARLVLLHLKEAYGYTVLFQKSDKRKEATELCRHRGFEPGMTLWGTESLDHTVIILFWYLNNFLQNRIFGIVTK